MSKLENTSGYDFTCSVLRRHNCLAHDWYYEPDGLTKRAGAYAGDCGATAAAVDTAGAATVAATDRTVHVTSERAAAAASAANAAANASTSSARPAAAASTVNDGGVVAAVPAAAAASVAAKPAAPAAHKPQRTEERERDRGGAPWLLGTAGVATLALAGLFFYKGMSVKPVETAVKETVSAPVVAAPVVAASAEPAKEVAAAARAAAPAVEEAPPATEPGSTSFYGVSDPSRVMAWSSEATFNPDYSSEPAAPAEPVTEAAPVAAAPAETEVAAAEPVVEAEPAKTEPGVTSYFGFAEKADATQLWAAEATMNPDYTAEAPAPAPAPEPVVEAVPEPAKTEPGVTSYFGFAEKADATQLWAAEATMNPDYTAEAPAPAPEPVAEAAPEPVKTEPGVTSYFGFAEKADATQPWAAPATVYAQPADVCHDALTAALKAGTLNFATSSWEITSDSNATLDKIAKLAKDCSGVTIEIGGHTDSTGTAAGNKLLSEQRAKAVVRYLTGAGVEASKLTAVGYGQDRPIASNDTTEGKRQNRRIEFTVSSQ